MILWRTTHIEIVCEHGTRPPYKNKMEIRDTSLMQMRESKYLPVGIHVLKPDCRIN